MLGTCEYYTSTLLVHKKRTCIILSRLVWLLSTLTGNALFAGLPIGPAARADFRRLYPTNAKTSTSCPSDDNRTKVTNSVTSARSLWWHVGPYFWPADLTRTANPIIKADMQTLQRRCRIWQQKSFLRVPKINNTQMGVLYFCPYQIRHWYTVSENYGSVFRT